MKNICGLRKTQSRLYNRGKRGKRGRKRFSRSLYL